MRQTRFFAGSRYCVCWIVLVLAGPPGYTQVNVLTANYDNYRSNANLEETELSPSNVIPGAFGKLGTLPVDGQVYAQPLYVSSVQIPEQGVRDVVYIATEHNSVYAYDAQTVAPPTLYWHVNLGPSVPSSFFSGGYRDINPEIGILSTGVIDPVAQVLYVVAETVQNGSAVFQLHALDLATGRESMNGPATVAGKVAGKGAGTSGNGTVAFDPATHIQRPGLLLANGFLYAGFGSHADQGLWHGWLIGYSAADLSQPPSVFNVTPNGLGGSMWGSGRGLAADDTGNVYAITGNGDYDGIANYSESFLKLSGNTLQVSDWYAPANEEYLSSNDYDLSAGAALIPGTHMLVGGDKNGSLYLVNGDSMGHLDSGGAAQIFPGVTFAGIYTFAMWNRSDGTYLYVQQQYGALLAYQYSNGAFSTVPVLSVPTNFDSGYSGLAISANGGQPGTGILWEITGDHSQSPVPGTLHAFDASSLNELWNSDMDAAQDALGEFPKFVAPTVANGRVYVPTFSGAVVVYGILPAGSGGAGQPAIAAVENAASYFPDTISPGEIVTIFGANLGPLNGAGLQLDSSGSVTRSLADTEVLFDSTPAAMIYASANQVSAVAPFELRAATSQVQVSYQGLLSDAFPVTVAPAAPGIFTAGSSGNGQAAAINQDGTVNSQDQPAAAGSVIVLYGTGGGQTTPAGADGSVVSGDNPPQLQLPVTVSIGGEPAQVLYAGGAPGLVAGVVQVNVQVPADIPGGAAVPVVLQVGGQAGQQAVSIAVQSNDSASMLRPKEGQARRQ